MLNPNATEFVPVITAAAACASEDGRAASTVKTESKARTKARSDGTEASAKKHLKRGKRQNKHPSSLKSGAATDAVYISLPEETAAAAIPRSAASTVATAEASQPTTTTAENLGTTDTARTTVPAARAALKKSATRHNKTAATFKKRQPRLPNSGEHAELASTLMQKLAAGAYECMVCCEMLHRNQRVWNCLVCFAIFHLNCISKWAQHNIDSNEHRLWRCPGCQYQRDTVPREFYCFCGKETNPKFSLGVPFGCGSSCLRARPNCPHPCPLQCHPGPCPPCPLKKAPISCFCGRSQLQSNCGTPDSAASCGQVCEKLLSCGKHHCDQLCHQGRCHQCEAIETLRCPCGKKEANFVCGNASFVSCSTACGRLFDCGVHSCTITCHKHGSSSDFCPFSPLLVSTCPCGRTALSENQRTKCTDPIPVCKETCQRLLDCGHQCRSQCHLGDCPPCPVVVDRSCRCGLKTVSVACHSEAALLCETICSIRRSCKRHSCNSKCCSIPPDRHDCTLVCGKKLECGNHTCQEQCHSGKCSRCLVAIFNEVSCNCGRTVLFPPVNCGTKLPDCRYPCVRAPTCEHRGFVPHLCHQSPDCPPCLVVVQAACVCGKEMIPNIPCWRRNQPVYCFNLCGRPLSCGHSCKHDCHPSDIDCHTLRSEHSDIVEGAFVCKQTCAKLLDCGHKCSHICHAGDCSVFECNQPVQASCACGEKRANQVCKSRTEIPCDDYCLVQQRNKRLAAALGIKKNAPPKKNPYTAKELLFFKQNTRFCLSVEQDLLRFISGGRHKYYFPAMNFRQRSFVRALCLIWNFEADEIDSGSNKSIVAVRTSNCSAPPMSMAEGFQHYRESISAANNPSKDQQEVEEQPKTLHKVLITAAVAEDVEKLRGMFEAVSIKMEAAGPEPNRFVIEPETSAEGLLRLKQTIIELGVGAVFEWPDQDRLPENDSTEVQPEGELQSKDDSAPLQCPLSLEEANRPSD